MKGAIVPLLIGLALGAGGMLLMPKEKEPAPPRAERPPDDTEQRALIAKMAEQISDLRGQVTSLQSELEAEREQAAKIERETSEIEVDAEPTETGGPVTDKELEAGLQAFAMKLQSIIMGQGDEARDALRALLKRAGPEGLAKVRAEFQDDSAGFQRRIIAAHALGQNGDEESIRLLIETLQNPESDMIDHRLASHALAFTDDPNAVDPLTQTARQSDDPGARANAAFGLIRREIDEGYDLYAKATDLSLEKGQPEAMQFLQSMFIMDDKILPYARERLTTYKNETAVIVLLELVKQKKDKGAIPQLRKLAYDANQPKSVQNAAKGILKSFGEE
ncbi:MAG: HEAT repeat domain-containing protein [Planctomycetota bacterium]